MKINHSYQLNPLESLFESFFLPVVRKEFHPSSLSPVSTFNSYQNPEINVSTNQDLLKLQILVPGMASKDLALTYSGEVLNLTSITKKKASVGTKLQDRNINMNIELPKEWKLSCATAKLKDGVLVICIPREKIIKKVIKIS